MRGKLLDKIKSYNSDDLDGEFADEIPGLSHQERIDLMKQGLEGMIEEGKLNEEEVQFLREYIRKKELH